MMQWRYAPFLTVKLCYRNLQTVVGSNFFPVPTRKPSRLKLQTMRRGEGGAGEIKLPSSWTVPALLLLARVSLRFFDCKLLHNIALSSPVSPACRHLGNPLSGPLNSHPGPLFSRTPGPGPSEWPPFWKSAFSSAVWFKSVFQEWRTNQKSVGTLIRLQLVSL